MHLPRSSCWNNFSTNNNMESIGRKDMGVSQQNISDVELLEFLVGYSNSNDKDKVVEEDLQPQQSYYHMDEGPSMHTRVRRRSRTRSCEEEMMGGMMERWEPGEIVDTSDEEEDSRLSHPKYSRSGLAAMRSKRSNKQNMDEVFIVHENLLSDHHRQHKKRGPRPKRLTANEKRQKREDANDRERQRMGKLNTAFDSLRHLLPKHGNDRELSKFETIQIAKNYIKALNQMLVQTDQYFDKSVAVGAAVTDSYFAAATNAEDFGGYYSSS